MVVYHADRLHKGIADRGANKIKTATLEIFTHGVGFRCSRWELTQGLPGIQPRLAPDELPDIAIECGELFLHSQECLCIGDGGFNFEPVADDAAIMHQLLHLPAVITRDALRMESGECFSIVLPLVE